MEASGWDRSMTVSTNTDFEMGERGKNKNKEKLEMEKASVVEKQH